jgi:RimJ/RimL family protein N-acetyltransferase
MQFIQTSDIYAFREMVWESLLKTLMPNNMLLGMLSARMSGEEPQPADRFAAILRAGELVGAVAQTIDGRPVFSAMPAEVARFALTEWLAHVGLPRTLFGAEQTIVELLPHIPAFFPKANLKTEKLMSYELQRVIMPAVRPIGNMRFAEAADEDLLVDWAVRFTIDCHLSESKSPTLRDDLGKKTRQSIESRKRVIWEIDGTPVSMAGAIRPAPFGDSIAWVYTPDEHRGKGYASQLVAEYSQYLLDQGSPRCLLFTDASNPVSNAIYQRIGYQHACDFLLLLNLS